MPVHEAKYYLIELIHLLEQCHVDIGIIGCLPMPKVHHAVTHPHFKIVMSALLKHAMDNQSSI